MRTKLPVWLATVMAAMLSMPATYALLRAYEVIFRSEPNPATVVWSAHIAMFWRVGIAGYVAGMLVPFAYVAAGRDLARFIRGLGTGVLVVGALIGIQGLLLP